MLEKKEELNFRILRIYKKGYLKRTKRRLIKELLNSRLKKDI